MSFSLWLTFFGASLLLAIAPGPDNLFVLTQSAVYGVRSGLLVVLGLMSGLVVQTLCAACGVAAVVAAVANGMCEKGRDVTVRAAGGDLVVNYTDERITLTGDAKLVYTGEAVY